MNNAQSLMQIEGPIVLAGAGKMGGAMLTGWLAQGLEAKRVVVIEPAASPEISARTMAPGASRWAISSTMRTRSGPRWRLLKRTQSRRHKPKPCCRS